MVIIPGAESRCRTARNGPEHNGTAFENAIEAFKNRHTKMRPCRPAEPQPTAHEAHALAPFGLGVVGSRPNAGRAPSHTASRDSGPSTPRPVSGGGFELPPSPSSNPVTRSPRAYRILKYRPTTRGASDAQCGLAWLCCGPTRGALLPMPSAESQPHRLSDRSAAKASKRLDHRVRFPWRASHARAAPWYIGRPRGAHAAQCGLGVVVVWPNALRAPPHAGSRVSSLTKAQPIGGGRFETSCSLCLNTVARGLRVYYPVKARPTARGTCACARATQMPAARWRSQLARRTTVLRRKREAFRRSSTLL